MADKAIIWRKLQDLHTWEDNPNQGDIGAIVTSINRFGYNESIIVWNDRVQGGNHRVMALHQLWQGGWRPSERDRAVRVNGGGLEVATWDVSHLESEQEANAFGIALNRTTRLGMDDPAKLAALLQDIAAVDETMMQATGYDGNDVDDLINDIRHLEDAGYMVDQQLQAKWGAEPTPIPQSLAKLPETLLIKKPTKRSIHADVGRKALNDILGGLPPVDVDYHIITIGRGKSKEGADIVQTFGFGNFIDWITDIYGKGTTVYLSTWSLNKDHAFMLLELLESGRIGKLSVLCDQSMTTRKEEINTILRVGIDLFDNARIKFIQNHAKVYCFRSPDASQFCTVTGSGNLSGLPRPENYVVSTDPQLYHEYVNKFFEPLLSIVG